MPKVPTKNEEKLHETVLRDDKEGRRIPKVSNLVEEMMELNLENKSGIITHDAGIVTDPPKTVSTEGGPRMPEKIGDKQNRTSSKTCIII